MRATTVMLVAMGLGLIGRWANNQKTLSAKMLVQVLFALVVIAMLDQGRTAGIAQGFAWLFLIAVALGKNSPIVALSKIK